MSSKKKRSRSAEPYQPAVAPAPLCDSHAHLDDRRLLEDLAGVVQRAAEVDVDRIVTVGTNLASSRKVLELAAAFPGVLFAAAGVHPHNASAVTDEDWLAFEAIWGAGQVHAVGEIGLDDYYDFGEPADQRAAFARQLEAAERFELPVIVHVRDAYDDAFSLLESARLPAGGVLHCFSGGPAECERALAMGLHVSFSGIVTFPKADELRAALALVPDCRLLIETDAPYLAPVPRRGRPNEPAFVVHTALRVAALRDTDPAELCRLVSANAAALLGLG